MLTIAQVLSTSKGNILLKILYSTVLIHKLIPFVWVDLRIDQVTHEVLSLPTQK